MMDSYMEANNEEARIIIESLGKAMKTANASIGVAQWGAGSFYAKVALKKDGDGTTIQVEPKELESVF